MYGQAQGYGLEDQGEGSGIDHVGGGGSAGGNSTS